MKVKNLIMQSILEDPGKWQRRVIYLLLMYHIGIPWMLAISWRFLGLGEFKRYVDFDVEWYDARMTLLKYAISISFSVIGATWFLASDRIGGSQLSDKTRLLLTWGWTFISVGLMSATLQIFFSYKECYGWDRMLANGGNYPNLYQEVRHCAYTHMLRFSHRFAVGPMFFGGVLVLLSLGGVLMNPQNSKEVMRNEES